jgi:hypothetical protein
MLVRNTNSINLGTLSKLIAKHLKRSLNGTIWQHANADEHIKNRLDRLIGIHESGALFRNIALADTPPFVNSVSYS